MDASSEHFSGYNDIVIIIWGSFPWEQTDDRYVVTGIRQTAQYRFEEAKMTDGRMRKQAQHSDTGRWTQDSGANQ